jgi:hypothetical protein
MVWLAICLPLMLVGIAIATVPLAYACSHQHRYGSHGADPHSRAASRAVVESAQGIDSPDVCPRCSALVLDQTTHENSAHAIAVS